MNGIQYKQLGDLLEKGRQDGSLTEEEDRLLVHLMDAAWDEMTPEERAPYHGILLATAVDPS